MGDRGRDAPVLVPGPMLRYVGETRRAGCPARGAPGADGTPRLELVCETELTGQGRSR
jgi:hypothetical protein